MDNKLTLRYKSYILAVLTFTIIALAYFYPVLQGKEILQSDIVQFKGSSKEIADYRAETGQEPYWTNTSFSGMPAYKVSAYYPNDYIGKLDNVLRFLPRPADYLFLYFFSFFILLSVFKIEWKLAVLGSLAFGLSTYFIIILGVGHNSKAHAIAYFPLVLAGIIAVFKKRHLFGFVLTSFAMALEVHASHPQMTYYLFFAILILGFFYLWHAIKDKLLMSFIKNSGILIVAVVLGIGVNATQLIATKHYKDVSTRSQSELTINPDGSPKEKNSGLDKSYITEYSYGFLETFNLFIPRFVGGGSIENVGTNSETYAFLNKVIDANQARGFVKQLPTYWGKQPIVSAPAYIGAITIFLFFIGVFLVDNTYKKWLVTATLFSLLMSYGKNFSLLTDFFIDYIPLYNIFRAVSSIQVIAELAIPLLAVLGLKEFFDKNTKLDKKLKSLKLATYIVGGTALFFTLFGRFIFSFEGASDLQLDKMLAGLSDAIIADRKSMLFQDSLRSLLLVTATAGILWLFLKQKINYTKSIALLVVFILFDLIGVARNYVNADKFVDPIQVEKPFRASKIDKEIHKDTSHFRVGNFTGNPLNEARTSYFHNSIGGYSAIKPRRYQELFDYQMNSKMNDEILNMLNTKYILFLDQKNNETYQKNEDANGNVWFVNQLKIVHSADEEMAALDHLNTKETAVIHTDFSKGLKNEYPKDTVAIIKLTKKEMTKFTYTSYSETPQFAVFSEMFFNEWQATIDGKTAPIKRVDYVLRGLEIPKGKHQIVFEFHPTIIHKGNTITLLSYILLFIIPLGWWGMQRRKNKTL